MSRIVDELNLPETTEQHAIRVLGSAALSYPLLLTVVAASLFLPGMASRDFWAPGEPIYAEVIRVMFQHDNWSVPMLNGQIYADKPILYFWLALAVSKIAGGVSEWSVRLPAALGGLGLVLVTYQFGRTFFDRETGLLSGLILATASRVFWESRFLRLDTVLSFFLLLGFFCFIKAFLKRAPNYFFLLAYCCFGLATLTKGPVGLVLPGLAILSFIAVSGRWHQLKEMRLVSGAVIVTALILPWLLVLHFRGEDQWLHDFIWIHNIRNYALEPIGHIRPFYYYFLNLPVDFLPWTMLIPGALIFYYPWFGRLKSLPSLALTCWFAAVFVFFTISKSKIAYYLLPLFPALALFVGNYLRSLTRSEALRGWHWRCTSTLLYIVIAAVFLGGIGIPFITYRLERDLLSWAAALALILVVGSLVMLRALRTGSREIVFWGFIATLVAALIVSSVGVLPYLDKYKSPRALAEFVRNNLPESAPVYIFRSTMNDFNYYARRDTIPVVSSEGDLATITRSESPFYLLINDKDLAALTSSTRRPDVMTEQRVGERKWYLVRLRQSFS